MLESATLPLQYYFQEVTNPSQCTGKKSDLRNVLLSHSSLYPSQPPQHETGIRELVFSSCHWNFKGYQQSLHKYVGNSTTCFPSPSVSASSTVPSSCLVPRSCKRNVSRWLHLLGVASLVQEIINSKRINLVSGRRSSQQNTTFATGYYHSCSLSSDQELFPKLSNSI